MDDNEELEPKKVGYNLGYYGCAPVILILLVVTVSYVGYHVGRWILKGVIP